MCCIITITTIIDACKNYITLTDSSRSIQTGEDIHIKCDRSIMNNSWYRFNGSVNDQMMPVGRVSMIRCGTVSPGWLVNAHPTGKYLLVSYALS